ncbi:bombesin receptor-activated protein c6orf89 [Holotrichia oblita]|uniref:Bombesin receptor-activated protein c6orf89 n=1 Tax=Holotrichia oblita TaxID=644536 RepID=A0ACB9T6T1_HOLOL|nr:bombesin receptor-activated protein c6orf89 [Holotrichia oblita]
MPEEELLKKYANEIGKLRKRAKKLNLSDAEVNKLFKQCFDVIKNNTKVSNSNYKAQKILVTFLKGLLILLGVLIIFYVLLNVHQPTASIVLRNVQSLIYPGFSLHDHSIYVTRFIIMFISEFYDESCLVENPFFYVFDMECWPCQNVYSVIDLSDYTNKSVYHSGIPYVFKSDQKYVTLKDIIELYKENKDIFDKDASRLTSTVADIKNIHDLINYSENSTKSSKTHISWRINRMNPARIVRTLFPRPQIISEWSGQSVERYIMIDEPNALHHVLPSFECSYVFVIQGSGQQTVILRPTQECTDTCRTISVVLKPSYVCKY